MRGSAWQSPQIGAAAASWLSYSLVPAAMTWIFVGIALTVLRPARARAAAEAHRLAEPVLPGGGARRRRVLLIGRARCAAGSGRVLEAAARAGAGFDGRPRASRSRAIGTRSLPAWSRTMWGALGGADARDGVRRDAAGSLVADAAAVRRGVRRRVPEAAARDRARRRRSPSCSCWRWRSTVPLIASLAWVAFAALAFQGLAAAHRSRGRRPAQPRLAGGDLSCCWSCRCRCR